MRNISRIGVVCCLGLLGGQPAHASDQNYPSRPVRIVVPYGPGGIGDFTARALAKELTDSLKATIVVENKPGASGLVAMNAVKAAAPDGYTLVMTSNTTLPAARHLFKALAYDPMKDFVHVGMVGVFGSVALVPKNSPFKTIPELVEFARKNPSKAFYGYTNASSQVPSEMLNARAGIRMQGVGYKEAGQASTDLLSGQIPFMFLDTVAAAPILQGGRVIPLAVTQTQRLEKLPEVATMTDFYPGFEFSGFISVSAPARTPPAIVDKLNAAVRAASASEAFRAAIESNGMVPKAFSVAELDEFLQSENRKWETYAATARLVPQ
ncbi:MAG: hypothetical protein ABS43_05860 [Bordetella sp. SCN 67-23]|nr:tripartite tricarboxylate transporter substrate binding protein [Burkholderiales bacterium]ODS75329.1 MAG: hypothetical protein ABS43_05860 [Bordetella sp. SCN 67-23]ODU89947.1 MAG: hypothetical protein ABT00_07165 [Bordetella sp. SCN 68-11]OJW88721.1 MAG: hypothetical protein BGO71_04625 [Burkholderiales bacterium 67-32]